MSTIKHQQMPWAKVDLEDRKKIYGKLTTVLKEADASDWITVKSLDQFVGNLSVSEKVDQCYLMIEGKASADKKEMVPGLIEKIKEACGDCGAQINISCSLAQGDAMGVIEDQTPLKGGDPVPVKHEEGQVILLDFWATWCPPCQDPMAHNQEMLEKNKEKWGDKVRIIGLSIDQDIEKLRNHIKAKGWTSVEHYHSRNGVSTADKIYGVQGVPHCLLIDTHGKIVFVGHPAHRKLEEDINALLEGKTIEGAGTTREGGDEEEGGEKTEEIDEETYNKKTLEFKTGLDAIMTDESMKEHIGKLQRAFFVLVVDQKLNAEGKMTGNFTCVTQLFGNEEAAKVIQEKTAPIVEKGGYIDRTMIR